MKLIVIILFLFCLLLSPTQILAQGVESFAEVDAINNRCLGTMPKEACPEVKKDDSVFGGLFDTITNLFISVTKSINLNQTVERAKNTDQAFIPVIEESKNQKEVLEYSLCGEGATGVYSVWTPKFAEDTGTDTVKDCENRYNSSFYPKNVHIIIP